MNVDPTLPRSGRRESDQCRCRKGVDWKTASPNCLIQGFRSQGKKVDFNCKSTCCLICLLLEEHSDHHEVNTLFFTSFLHNSFHCCRAAAMKTQEESNKLAVKAISCSPRTTGTHFCSQMFFPQVGCVFLVCRHWYEVSVKTEEVYHGPWSACKTSQQGVTVSHTKKGNGGFNTDTKCKEPSRYNMIPYQTRSKGSPSSRGKSPTLSSIQSSSKSSQSASACFPRVRGPVAFVHADPTHIRSQSDSPLGQAFVHRQSPQGSLAGKRWQNKKWMCGLLGRCFSKCIHSESCVSHLYYIIYLYIWRDTVWWSDESTFPLNFKLNHFQSSCFTPKHHGGFLLIEFLACFAKQLCTIAQGLKSNIQRWLLSGHPTTVTNKFTKAWRNFSAPESVAKDSSQLSLPSSAAAARPQTLLQSRKMMNTTYSIEVGILSSDKNCVFCTDKVLQGIGNNMTFLCVKWLSFKK